MRPPFLTKGMEASFYSCFSLMATDRILWRPPGWGPFAALSSIVCPFRVRRPGVSHRARAASAPRHANSVSSSNSCGCNRRSASCRARVTRSSCSNRALRSTPRANACSRPTMSWLSAGASLPEATTLTMSLDQLYRQYSVSRTPSFNAASAAATGSSSPRAGRQLEQERCGRGRRELRAEPGERRCGRGDREMYPLTAADHRDGQPRGLGSDEDDQRMRRRLLKCLEQAIGRIDIQFVRRVDRCDLIRTVLRRQGEILNEFAHLIDADDLALFRRRHPSVIGMAAGRQ